MLISPRLIAQSVSASPSVCDNLWFTFRSVENVYSCHPKDEVSDIYPMSMKSGAERRLALLITLALIFAAPGLAGVVNGKASGMHNQAANGCNCHGGSGGVTISFSGLPTDYTAGQGYALSIGGTGGPSGSKGGFNLEGNKGSFSNAGSNVKISGGSVTHSASSARSWTVTWTAPSSGSGDASFTLAVNFVNGDGNQNNALDDWASTTVTVPESAAANTPPVASNVRITTSLPSKATGLQMAYDYSDSDSDPESGTTIEWSLDGSHAAAHDGQSSISGASLNRGGVWTVAVTPNDGTDFGSEVTSSSATIGNAPPSVSSVSIAPVAPSESDQLILSYAYADLDGDAEGSTIIEWYRDSVRIAELDGLTSVSSIATRASDSWRASITPLDNLGEAGPVETSQTIIIGSSNSDPVLSNAGFTGGATTSTAMTDADITAAWSFFDSDGDTETDFEIEWMKGGAHESIWDDEKILPSTATSHGDVWSYRVRANDGLAWSDWLTSSTMTISNSAPVLSNLSVTPVMPKTDDDLVVSWSYFDLDGDAESGSSIVWYRNGTQITALDDLMTVPATSTARGESWSVQVSLGDGVDMSAIQSIEDVNISSSNPVVENLSLSSSATEGADSLHPLTLMFNSSDADNDQVVTSIRWIRNGFTVASLANLTTVPIELLGVGQIWMAEVTAADAGGSSTVSSSSITISNIPPTASFSTPTSFLSDSAMTLDGSDSIDADGEIVAWFWTVAGVRYGGESVTVTLPAGSALVNLTVLDEHGGSASLERSVEVVTGPIVTDLSIATANGMVVLDWVWSGESTNFTIWRSVGPIDSAASLTELQPVAVANTSSWSEPMHIVGSHGYAVTVEIGGSDNLRIDTTANAGSIDLATSDLVEKPVIEGESVLTSILVVIWLLVAALVAFALAVVERRGGAAR